MKRCEVLEARTLAVGKGSIVIVSDLQYNTASEYLKPLKEEEVKEEKPKFKIFFTPKKK